MRKLNYCPGSAFYLIFGASIRENIQIRSTHLTSKSTGYKILHLRVDIQIWSTHLIKLLLDSKTNLQ